jgi:hypothetical protein
VLDGSKCSRIGRAPIETFVGHSAHETAHSFPLVGRGGVGVPENDLSGHGFWTCRALGGASLRARLASGGDGEDGE